MNLRFQFFKVSLRQANFWFQWYGKFFMALIYFMQQNAHTAHTAPSNLELLWDMYQLINKFIASKYSLKINIKNYKFHMYTLNLTRKSSSSRVRAGLVFAASLQSARAAAPTKTIVKTSNMKRMFDISRISDISLSNKCRGTRPVCGSHFHRSCALSFIV